MLENGAELRYLHAILGHERLETTQIYTRVSLRKLLETHDKSHPAEQPRKDEPRKDEPPKDEPPKDEPPKDEPPAEPNV